MTQKPHYRSSFLLFLICLAIFILQGHTFRFCRQTAQLSFISTALAAETEIKPFNFEKTGTKIKELSQQLRSGQLTPQLLEEIKQQSEQLGKVAATCIETTTGQITRLDQELSSLGPALDHDSVETAKERKSLLKKKQSLSISLSECRLTTTLLTRLDNELLDQDKSLPTANVLAKSETLSGRLTAKLPALSAGREQLREYLTTKAALPELPIPMLLIFGLLLIVGAFVGIKIHRLTARHLTAYLEKQGVETVPTVKGSIILPIALALLLAGTYLLYATHGPSQAVYSPWLLLSISLYCIALFLWRIRMLLLPGRQGNQILPQKAAVFTLLTLFSVALLFTTRLDLSDFSALATLCELMQSVLICAICLTGCWFFWPERPMEATTAVHYSRKAGVALITALIMIIELSGYRALSLFVLVGLLNSVLLAALLFFILFFIDQLIGGFQSGKYHWQRGLRQRLGLLLSDHLTGITWIRLLIKIFTWSLAVLILLKIWGLPETKEKLIHNYLVAGFNIGGLVIAPARILFGIFIFACGWTLFAWMELQTERRWVKRAGFSASAEETLVIMTRYCGFALAVIFGLSIAGFSFSNLAVIAGALSVGIGFGMQNIVNNFVSGLIILFERPVKRGDWISIGNTEGYIQKISVRSTVIQTFDRSDVIVPNSELISNQVTNMMLHDNYGRLIVPVGVAYGSDTELVRTILLDIAHNNDQVIVDGSAPKPNVLFLAFGDNSLNFELRCHLANIDKRLLVKSAINYEIDRAFRRHKISMPFPQRDIYIKEFPHAAGTSGEISTKDDGKQ